jgi:hypothetical protein
MKIIINNKSLETDSDALKLVHRVMQDGLISGNGKSYCYATVFNDVVVYAERISKTTHKFELHSMKNEDIG